MFLALYCKKDLILHTCGEGFQDKKISNHGIFNTNIRKKIPTTSFVKDGTLPAIQELLGS